MSAQVLKTFLEDPGRPTGTLKYHELQGFLFAVASAPELVPPSEWMPIVFGDQEPEHENMSEAKAVLTELMALYNTINAVVAAEQPTLPADCTIFDDPLANLDEDAPIALWSRGLLRGHQWLSESWESYVPEEFDEEFGAVLMTLTFFSSKRLADAYCAETQGRLADVAGTICRVFPGAVAEYAQLGRSIHRVICEAERSEGGEHLRAKIGRNEPCPCGSGKKYKRCCGAVTR